MTRKWAWMDWARAHGINFSIPLSWLDASQDICKACGARRKFHRRNTDHKFKEEK